MSRAVDCARAPAVIGTGGARIRSVQPDRDHAVLELVGTLDRARVDELRQRLTGLLVGGARFLLVDLAEVGPCDPALTGVLTAFARRRDARQGWLRVHAPPSSLCELNEATLADLFAIYRAAGGVIPAGGGPRAAGGGPR